MTKQHDVPNVWTPDEDATLREFAHEGNGAVALRLGRTPTAIQQRASKLHVSLAKPKVSRSVDTPFAPLDAGILAPLDAAISGSRVVIAQPDDSAASLASVFVTPDTDMTPAEMIAMIAEQETCPDSLAELEADADAFAEAVTTGALLAMARAEIAELRIELMMLALRDKLGDDAESFASEFIFPAIEAAENAAEVAV